MYLKLVALWATMAQQRKQSIQSFSISNGCNVTATRPHYLLHCRTCFHTVKISGKQIAEQSADPWRQCSLRPNISMFPFICPNSFAIFKFFLTFLQLFYLWKCTYFELKLHQVPTMQVMLLSVSVAIFCIKSNINQYISFPWLYLCCQHLTPNFDAFLLTVLWLL